MRTCCVPNCRTNYKGAETATVFRFPKDQQLRNKWIKQIRRKDDFVPSKDTVVCEKHFHNVEIVRQDKLYRDDGKWM